jgi:hypothetical protein
LHFGRLLGESAEEVTEQLQVALRQADGDGWPTDRQSSNEAMVHLRNVDDLKDRWELMDRWTGQWTEAGWEEWNRDGHADSRAGCRYRSRDG